MGRKFRLEEKSHNNPAPSGVMIKAFFVGILGYNESKPSFVDNRLLVRFTRSLSSRDAPLVPELSGLSCISNIVVDLLTGKIIDHYFKVNNGTPIRNNEDSYFIYGSPIDQVLRYHFNLVHMSREYIAGGWLYRTKINQQLETNRKKFVFITGDKFCKNLTTFCIGQTLCMFNGGPFTMS